MHGYVEGIYKDGIKQPLDIYKYKIQEELKQIQENMISYRNSETVNELTARLDELLHQEKFNFVSDTKALKLDNSASLCGVWIIGN